MSPELSFLREIGRAEFHTVTDEEALDGTKLPVFHSCDELSLIKSY